jgi:hypothetical protein
MTSRINEVMMKKIWRIPIFLLLIVIFGVSIIVGAIISIPESTVQNLRFEVWTDKETYEVNETITIHLKIINPTLSEVSLHFNSGYQLDYIILDQNNTQLYKWSNDKMFLQILTGIRIDPFSSHKRTFNHAPKHHSLQLGMYTIRGLVVGYFAKDTTIEVLET